MSLVTSMSMNCEEKARKQIRTFEKTHIVNKFCLTNHLAVSLTGSATTVRYFLRYVRGVEVI